MVILKRSDTVESAFTKRIWGTKQVAEYLGIPEWRVKNFSEGEAYGLPPSQRTGTGRGSRRLYNIYDVLRLAIANELVNFGFGPESVGAALRAIPESMLAHWPALTEIGGTGEIFDTLPILVNLGSEEGWRVVKAPKALDSASDALEFQGSRLGIFVLNFPSVLAPLLKNIAKEFTD